MRVLPRPVGVGAWPGACIAASPGLRIAEGPQERAGHGFVRCGSGSGTTAHKTVTRGGGVAPGAHAWSSPSVKPPGRARRWSALDGALGEAAAPEALQDQDQDRQ